MCASEGTEYVVLVDRNDNPIGREEKVRCHMPDGRLHRAFTAILFDGAGRLVLARRAPGKMLWPGCWDGTFASHPRESEGYVASGARRMPEEISAACDLDYMNKFEYHVPYRDIGSENEICATLVGVVDDTALEGAQGEIDDIRAVTASELAGEIAREPMSYCPWMLIALRLLGRSDQAAMRKHSGTISKWGIHDALDAAIRKHLSDDMWRLADGQV